MSTTCIFEPTHGSFRCATCGLEDQDHTFLHQITERAEGPDLDDIVRLIRYCRGHRIVHMVSGGSGPLGVRIIPSNSDAESVFVMEGFPEDKAHFVGPDGTVYEGPAVIICPMCWDSHGCSLPVGHDGDHVCEPEHHCGSRHDGSLRIDGPDPEDQWLTPLFDYRDGPPNRG
jgi:hypothetical protein